MYALTLLMFVATCSTAWWYHHFHAEQELRITDDPPGLLWTDSNQQHVVKLTGVDDGSAADKQGVRALVGRRILVINRQPVWDADDARAIVEAATA
eukprot:gene21399-17200_t